MLNKTIILALGLNLIACGAAEQASTTASATEDKAAADKAAAADKEGSVDASDKKPGGYLQGYVVSAFDMSVDGEHYSDSEDFYTQQIDKLEAQAQEAGYGDYSMRFDAKIGLDDLKYGMKVYIASEDNVGFAADTKVNESGRFKVSIPDGLGGEAKFRIRTNKRVSVILTSADKKNVVKWCYNFSGVETNGSLAAPAIITNFQTKLTKYDCEVSTSGLQIPAKAKAAAPAPAAPAASDEVSNDEGAAQ